MCLHLGMSGEKKSNFGSILGLPVQKSKETEIRKSVVASLGKTRCMYLMTALSMYALQGTTDDPQSCGLSAEVGGQLRS